MKKVVLLGDSIRMGYDKYVKQALDGVVDVFYPDVNCQFSEAILRHVHEWRRKYSFPEDTDLIHWNAGLWDALELFEDEPLISIDYYAEVIARIDKRLRLLFPCAKMIFATSTAVLEEKCSKDFRRHNSTIEAYNNAAITALKDTDTVINDLYALSVQCPATYHSDAVHFYTDEGTELLGGKVLGAICAELGVEPKRVNIKDFNPEGYSKQNIGY